MLSIENGNLVLDPNGNNTTTIQPSATGNRIITIPDITDTLVTKTSTDILTNKILTDNTNNIISRGLWSGSGTGYINTYTATAPTPGQVLMAIDETTANWQTHTINALTSLNTLTNGTQTFATGSSGSDFGISSSGSVHTFNIPDASSTNRGLITTGAQTFAGTKTFSSPPIIGSIVNTGTVTFPTSTDTLVGRNTTDTLTNKTLTNPNISTILNTGTLTLPTNTDTLIGRNTVDTLTNKTLTNPIISSIFNTGTLTLPTSTDTLIGRNTTDTLTNKTLTNPTISTILNTGTLTLPTSTDTLIGRNTTDFLTNKSSMSGSSIYNTGTASQLSNTVTGVGTTWTSLMIGGLIIFANGIQSFITAFNSTTSLTVSQSQTVSSQTYTLYYGGYQIDNIGNVSLSKLFYTQAGTTAIFDGTVPSKRIMFQTSGATAATTLTIASTQSTSQTLTIPNITGSDTISTLALAQVLTNKTLPSNTTWFQDNIDSTKKLQFALSGITTGTTRTLTIPNTSDTIATLALAQVLTNKTIDSASNTLTLNANTITSGILPVSRGGLGVGTLTQNGWLMGNGTGVITSIKNNMNAIIGPNNTTDDGTLGYAVGSRWFDTTADKEYVCLDSTTGAAVWLETTSGGSGSGGISSLNALTGLVQTFATGTSGTDFGISSTGSVHTFNIPDASATSRGLITTGNQTFAGTKTFSAINTTNHTVGNIGINTSSPIAFIGASSNGGMNISLLTFNVPTGTTRDMAMICHITLRSSGGYGTLATPNGWQLLTSIQNNYGGATYFRTLYVFTKNATNSEPTSYTWTNITQSANNWVIGGISTFSGVSAFNIINTVNTLATTNQSSLRFDVPSITTTVENTMLVAYYTYASCPSSWSVSGGMTKMYTANSAAPPVEIGEGSMAAYKFNSSIGSVGGTGVFTATVTNYADYAFTCLLALTPVSNGLTLTSASTLDIGPNNVTFVNMGNQNAPTNMYNLTTSAGYPTTKGLVIRGAAGQSANLSEVQDASGNILSGFNSNGQLILGGSANNSFKHTIVVAPTDNRTITFPDITCAVVCKTSTDTLTNKTLTDNTNIIRATQLGTNGNDVIISGSSAPVIGQALVAASETTATWQTIDGMIWLGAWNSSTAYVINNVVTSGGACYVCISNNTNNIPPNATYWTVLATANTAGSTSQVQYNNSGALSGASSLSVGSDGYAIVGYSQGTLAIPNSGSKIFSRFRAGRYMLAQIGPSGMDYSFQPSIFSNKISWWTATGNGSTVSVINFGVSNTGTVTTRNITTTNLFTSMRRVGFVSTATAGSSAGTRHGIQQFWRGNASGLGGFFYVVRFGLSSASNVATQRSFVGFCATTSVLGNSDPSTSKNVIGFAVDSADSTWYFIHNDNTANCEKDALTGTFPPRSLSANMFEARIFCPPNSSTIYYSLEDMNGGSFYEGSTNTNIPDSTTLLSPQIWTNNGTTALACGIDVVSQYIETDY